ncbi:MAG TPA: carboxypeptidase regulatory-like domain-containing protein [Candidatus Angelobacter sp.]|nr:carboxypeptidase regulatory-like domain-containing protein [Candidatus Angelobacter sp.]
MKTSRDVRVFLFVCLALFCLSSVAQVLKGSISGTVVDPQGAVVSNAQIKATHISTGVVLNSKSDNAGLFHFNLIPVGTYKIEVSAAGFKTAVQSDISVAAGRDSGLGDVALAVGGTSETVEVTAVTPLIETTQAQVTNTFSGQTLQTFAGIQENQGLDNLALFVPGVVSVRDQGFSNTNGGLGFSSNGLRGRNNDQEVDGQNNNDNSVGGPSLIVSDNEFVGQYVLVTNNFGPEYGRNSGSVVNIITKSGTNAWHGSVYADENASNLNSMSNFMRRFDTDAQGNPLTRPPRLNDEFGGFTVGGPIVKNKAFFFGGFDEEIVSNSTIFATGSVAPTPAGVAQLNGCFPGSTALAAYSKIGPYAFSAGNPFPTNVTPVDVGTCTGVPFGGVTRVLPTPQHVFNWVTKTDLQLGSDTIVARYLFNRNDFFNLDVCGGTGVDCGANGFPVNVPALSQSFLLGDTHNFTSRLVNEARVSFSRLNVDFGGNQFGSVPTSAGVDQAVSRINFQTPGTLSIGVQGNFPQSRIVNTWQAQDNWSYVLGKHALKAGVNWTYQRSPNVFLPNINGTFTYADWTNFVANTPAAATVADGNPSLDFREYDTFLYGGDDWKISKNLTLNIGLTWTYYGAPQNLFHQISTANQTGPNPLWKPTLPLSVTTFPEFSSPKNSFGPSFGFAYSPQWGGFLTGHGRTTIRGGYRYLYDPPYYNIFVNMSSSAPEVLLDTFTPAPIGIPSVATGPNVRAAYHSLLQTGVFDPRSFSQTSLASNFGPDKVHSWSLGLEREISKNSAVEVRYAGNHGYNLFQSINANPLIGPLATHFPNLIPAGVTPCPAAQAVVPRAVGREFCNEGVLRERDNGGFSNYHSVQAEFRANNLFKQLTIRTAYTYSKTLDNVSEIFSTFGGGNSVAFAQNSLAPGGEYGLSGLNIPHQWTILFNEDLPFFREQHGVIGHVLGGWSLSGNYILASGQGYTPSTAFSARFTEPNFFDNTFNLGFIGVDTARPFIGSLSAPATSVGMFAGDACSLFSFSGTDPLCTGNPNQLINLTAVGASGCESNSSIPCPFVAVSNNQVRFIANTGIAQTVFGTPFGNTARNIVTDAITNTMNAAVIKKIKISERNSFEFHMSMLNVLNHQNFGANGIGIDPFVEDAGLASAGTGFGDVSVQNTSFPGSNFGTRRITFGGVFRF